MIAHVGLYCFIFSVISYSVVCYSHEIKEHIQYCRTIQKKFNTHDSLVKIPVSKDAYILPCRIVEEKKTITIEEGKCLEESSEHIISLSKVEVCDFYYLFEDPQPEFSWSDKRRVSFWHHYDFLSACLNKNVTVWDALRIYIYVYPEVLQMILQSKVFQAEKGSFSRDKTTELYSLLLMLLNVFFSCDTPENMYFLVIYGSEKTDIANGMLDQVCSDLDSIGLSVTKNKSEATFDSLKRTAMDALLDNVLYRTLGTSNIFDSSYLKQFIHIKYENIICSLQHVKNMMQNAGSKAYGVNGNRYVLQDITPRTNSLQETGDAFEENKNKDKVQKEIINPLSVAMQLVGSMSNDYFNINIQDNYFPHDQMQDLVNGHDVVCQAVTSPPIQIKSLQECYENDQGFRESITGRKFSAMTAEQRKGLVSIQDLVSNPNNTLIIPNATLYDKYAYFYDIGVEHDVVINYGTQKGYLYFDQNKLLNMYANCSNYEKKHFKMAMQSRQKILRELQRKPTLGLISSVFAVEELSRNKKMTSLSFPYDSKSQLLYFKENYAVCSAINDELLSLDVKLRTSPEGSLWLYERRELDNNKLLQRINDYLFEKKHPMKKNIQIL